MFNSCRPNPGIIGCLIAVILAIHPPLACCAATAASTLLGTQGTGEDSALGMEVAQQAKPSETVWLTTGQDKFLALFIPDQSGKPKGAAIILHDADDHPDFANVIRPLRTYLPNSGWATVSIQLPRLTSLATTPQQTLINARIQKAADHLHSVGFNNLALIGHGSGALAAAVYLSSGAVDPSIRGFVGISMGVLTSSKDQPTLTSLLEKIKVPILDIYGSQDISSVTATARDRSLSALKLATPPNHDSQLEHYKKAGLSKTANDSLHGYIAYRQVAIEGARHDFQDMELTLNKRVLGWLERHVKGMTITAPSKTPPPPTSP